MTSSAATWRVLSQFGALPRTLVWDQESAIGRWRGRDMCFTAEFPAFRGTLGIGALLCRRGHPEAKGLVERSNGYLESSSLPGRIFEDVGDFNHQLSGWLVRANHPHPRHHQGPTARGHG
jgi:transposase